MGPSIVGVRERVVTAILWRASCHTLWYRVRVKSRRQWCPALVRDESNTCGGRGPSGPGGVRAKNADLVRVVCGGNFVCLRWLPKRVSYRARWNDCRSRARSADGIHSPCAAHTIRLCPGAGCKRRTERKFPWGTRLRANASTCSHSIAISERAGSRRAGCASARPRAPWRANEDRIGTGFRSFTGERPDCLVRGPWGFCRHVVRHLRHRR